MRRYECVVILEPDMKDDDIQGFTQQYSQLIKDHGGEMIKVEDWGIKKLAYLVKKREKGRYVLLDYVGTPELISELERKMKISEDVMKFLSVKLDQDVDLEAFRAQEQAKKEAVAQAKAAEEAAAQARAEEQAAAAQAKAAEEAATEAKAEEETAAQAKAAEETAPEALAAQPDEPATPTAQGTGEPSPEPTQAQSPESPGTPDQTKPDSGKEV